MPEAQEKFTPEVTFANGRRVYTMDMAVVLARVPHGPDSGLTELDARHYAALFAQAYRMHALCAKIASGLDCGFDSPITSEAQAIMSACIPKPKGQPFKPKDN